MRQKSNSTPASSETLVRNIRRATRKRHAAEEKIRIVLDGLRGETSIAEPALELRLLKKSMIGDGGDQT
jgi:transposase